MQSSISSRISREFQPQKLLPLLLAGFITGIFSLVLGTFRLGDFIQYLPYSVISGFLTGTGWILVRGALGTMVDLPTHLADLPELFQTQILVKWLPGLIFAVLLLVILRRFNHSLIVPGMLFMAIEIFYLITWLTHLSIVQASPRGVAVGTFPPREPMETLDSLVLGKNRLVGHLKSDWQHKHHHVVERGFPSTQC